MAENKAEKFVFYMYKMTKSYPPNKEVLKDISLSFYYGAKIGIIGQNGAGKSTLLRIMAGIDKDIQGEAKILKGYRALLVPQEPKLNPEKTVRGNLEEAMEPIQKMIERYDEVMAKMGDEMSEKEQQKLNDEFDYLQNEIDRLDGWNIDHLLDVASSALVLPPDDADVTKLSGGERRRVASPCVKRCWPSLICCCWTNRPTIWTLKRSHGSKRRCANTRAPSSS